MHLEILHFNIRNSSDIFYLAFASNSSYPKTRIAFGERISCIIGKFGLFKQDELSYYTKKCLYNLQTLLFIIKNYFNVITAPTSSSLAFISSASSLATPSLSVLGAPSTKSFASFKPRPVSSLTTLITLIF